MYPIMRKSVFCGFSAQTGHFSKVTKGARPLVSWSTPASSTVASPSLPCPCNGRSMGSSNGSRRSAGLAVSQTFWISTRSVASATAAAQGSPAVAQNGSQSQWDLYAGIVVERKPIVTRNKNELQERYTKYMNQLEFELSKKSDHEVRRENDLKMLEKVKAGDADLGNVQTARDDEDKWAAEAQNFQPASRITDADKKNDIKSLERGLDSHLLLVVEQKLGNDFRWICPHSKLEDGETLRDAAERMLRTNFTDIRVKILGNAPWGFYKYKYPKNASSESSIGAKVFFYKAQVVAGELRKDSNSSVINDFAWLKRNELESKLQPEYYRKLSECLIDE